MLMKLALALKAVEALGGVPSEQDRTRQIHSKTSPETPMSSKFEKFSERARKVLTLAQEEAQRFNHNCIGTEQSLRVGN